MPFNRDLIDSGCTLKTYNGDLSLLEHVIDFSVNKSDFSQAKVREIKSDPVVTTSKIDVSLPKQARRIKEVVYGDNLEELSWTGAGTVPAPVDTAASNISNVSHTPKGFCFRHMVEEDETATSAVSPDVNTATIQHNVQVHESGVLQHSSAESRRVTRSVKDVVYGDCETDRPFCQSRYSEQKCNVS
jgi:hypothetical protein